LIFAGKPAEIYYKIFRLNKENSYNNTL